MSATTRRAAPTPVLARPDSARVASLDGLRGVAAVVVFVHHVFLARPALAEPYRGASTHQVEGIAWWFTHTPLHLIWAGTEAVFVFFVLSGLVLVMPFVAGARFDLAAYYPRRLLRLYLPVWAAIVLAVGWAAAFPRRWQSGDSWWFAANVAAPTSSGAVNDALLLLSPGSSNYVLWSLQWEVVYSLALPLVIVFGRVGRRIWPLKVTVVLGALVAGAALECFPLWYLSIFALGALMAFEHRRLARWAAFLHSPARPAWWWCSTLLGSLVLLLSYWFLPAGEFELAAPVIGAVRGLQALGACGVVFVAWHWSAAARALTSAPTRWLGARSFSLYLVHLPVVASVTLLLGGRPHLVGVLVLSAAITFPLTMLFYRWVELPSHRVARKLGQRRTGSCPDTRPGRNPVRPATDTHIHKVAPSRRSSRNNETSSWTKITHSQRPSGAQRRMTQART